MKKIFSALLSILLALGLFSCSHAFTDGPSISLNLGATSTSSSFDASQIGFVSVRIITDPDYQVIFNGSFKFGSKIQITDIPKCDANICVNIHSIDGDIIGSGSTFLAIKNGQNTVQLSILITNEIQLETGVLGSITNPVTNLADLKTVINNISSRKIVAIYATSTCLSADNIEGYSEVFLGNGKKISLHFVQTTETQEEDITVSCAAYFTVTGDAYLRISDDHEKTVFIVPGQHSGTSLPYELGSFIVQEGGTLDLFNVGFGNVYLLKGTVNLDGTKFSRSNSQLISNKIITQDAGVADSKTITFSHANDAQVVVADDQVELILNKNASQNNPVYMEDYSNASYNPAGGTWIFYDYESDYIKQGMNQTKPCRKVTEINSMITSLMDEPVDFNDYLFCANGFYDSEQPEFFFDKDGNLIRCLDSLNDLNGAPDGCYYISSTMKEMNEQQTKSIRGNYEVKAKALYSTDSNFGINKDIPSMDYSIVDSVFEIPADSSLTLSNITFNCWGDLTLTKMIQNDGTFTLRNCYVFADGETENGDPHIFVQNKGKLILDGSHINGNVQNNGTLSLKGEGSFIQNIFLDSGKTVTLEPGFIVPESTQNTMSLTTKEELEDGMKVVQNNAGVKDLVSIFMLSDYANQFFIGDDGTITSPISEWTGFMNAIYRQQKYIFLTKNPLPPLSSDPIVIDSEVHIIYIGYRQADGKNYAKLDRTGFLDTRSLFTVKKGGSLTLDRIELTSVEASGTTSNPGSSSYALVTVEEGASFTANNCKFNHARLKTPAMDTRRGNFIDASGKVTLTNCELHNKEEMAALDSEYPLIYVAETGSLYAKNTAFSRAFNTKEDGISADFIYTDGKVDLQDCAISNIKYGNYISDVGYNQTDPYGYSAMESVNPLIFASSTSSLSLKNTSLWGNQVTRSSNDLPIGSLIHTQDSMEKCANIKLTDVRCYVTSGTCDIFTGAPLYKENLYYADPAYMSANINGISFDGCKSTHNIYSAGDLYIKGALNITNGIFLHYNAGSGEENLRMPKLIKTGAITNTTSIAGTSGQSKISLGFYDIESKVNYDLSQSYPYSRQVLVPYEGVELEKHEAFNLFSIQADSESYTIDEDGYVINN